MVVKLEQFLLTISRPLQTVRFFTDKAGYEEIFSCKLENPPIKKGLMRSYGNEHTIHYLKKRGSVNIEIVTYKQLGYHRSSFTPYIRLIDGQKDDTSAYTSLPITTDVSIAGGLYTPPLLRVKTHDEEGSYRFWSMVGFEPFFDTASIATQLFIFRSPFHQDVVMQFEKECDESTRYLDDEGWTSLAFLSSNLEKDHAFFDRQGFEPTLIDTLKINNKNIQFFFIREPGGMIIEFLSASV